MSQLQYATKRLADTVAEVEAELARRAEQPPHTPPHLQQDATGRYILVDAYAALVTGYAALERSRRG
ncbi:hypothetical protein [Phycicoccus sp.]|uniref:hypothetical protein n=1 Tax=Phycicoccus sp. TaxID=1902410 RepID=UPI002BF5E57D|nr:hypothetical protein [Phycicoccus sp.]HMM95332.1 hypothetical protein [Phycicoccus sp.]